MPSAYFTGMDSQLVSQVLFVQANCSRIFRFRRRLADPRIARRHRRPYHFSHHRLANNIHFYILLRFRLPRTSSFWNNVDWQIGQKLMSGKHIVCERNGHNHETLSTGGYPSCDQVNRIFCDQKA